MATNSAIAHVGQSLIALLRDQIGSFVDDDEIALVSPGAEGAGDDFRLSLYLYDITQNEHLSNERPPVDPTEQAGHKLALDLHYLLTAHAKEPNGDPPTTRTSEQHDVLGRAMQVFNDNGIIRAPNLAGDLSSNEELSISMESVSREDLVNIWTTFQDTGYEPSVAYVVSPVLIESKRTAPIERVHEAEINEYRLRLERGDNDG